MALMSSTELQVLPTRMSRLSVPVSTVPAGIALALAVKKDDKVDTSMP